MFLGNAIAPAPPLDQPSRQFLYPGKKLTILRIGNLKSHLQVSLTAAQLPMRIALAMEIVAII
jgi:hypothetical protein